MHCTQQWCAAAHRYPPPARKAAGGRRPERADARMLKERSAEGAVIVKETQPLLLLQSAPVLAVALLHPLEGALQLAEVDGRLLLLPAPAACLLVTEADVQP